MRNGSSNTQRFSVLVVDDDPECLNEFADLIRFLGYRCSTTGAAADALTTIANDPEIGIVLTDLRMPTIDGLTLLDELASRFMRSRPLVTLIATGDASLQNAVQAMRFNAADFLAKPVSFEDLAGALRRATARWLQLNDEFRASAIRSSLPQVQETGSSDGGKPSISDPDNLKAFVKHMQKSRQGRADLFDKVVSSEPVWDILLDLTAAALDGTPVPVSSVCAACQVPFSTAFRHVRQLIDAGMVRSWKDPVDKRRTMLELEPQTLERMKSHLDSIRKQHLRTAE